MARHPNRGGPEWRRWIGETDGTLLRVWLRWQRHIRRARR